MSDAVQPFGERPNYFYLRYVKLGQLAEFKSDVSAWLIVSLVAVFGGSAIDTSLTALPHSAPLELVQQRFVTRFWFLFVLPRQFWYLLAVAIISWVFRGKTIPITLPDLDFIAWVLLNALLCGAAIAYALLPWWEAFPIQFGLLCLGLIYERLIDIGKNNYAGLRQAGAADSQRS